MSNFLERDGIKCRGHHRGAQLFANQVSSIGALRTNKSRRQFTITRTHFGWIDCTTGLAGGGWKTLECGPKFVDWASPAAGRYTSVPSTTSKSTSLTTTILHLLGRISEDSDYIVIAKPFKSLSQQRQWRQLPMAVDAVVY